MRNGQTVQTTIVALERGPARVALLGAATTAPPSCGDLGDLPPGAIVTSSVRFDPPADGCGNTLEIVPEALTTGALSDTGNGWATLTLPDGCVGTFDVELKTLSANSSIDDTSYLDNGLANGEPHWWLVRTFTPAAGACASGKSGACSDAFVAKNAIVGQ
jgi:hypothetical protein